MHLSASEWKYLDERTSHFTGRSWVFERVRSFLAGSERMLVLCGPPGTGKTAIAAQLARASAGRDGFEAEAPLEAGTFDAAVICRAGRTDLLDVAQRLAAQLTDAVPGFGEQQQQALTPSVTISDVTVSTGHVADSDVAGVRISLDRLGPERAFSSGVALPLARLAESQPERPAILLVDALDETFARSAARELPRAVSELAGVRAVITARDDPRVLSQLGDSVVRLHLLDDAPDVAAEIFEYVLRRLGDGLHEATTALARRIADEARGNFLYCKHVVDSLAGRLAELTSKEISELPLPRGGLAGVYREFLRRELARDEAAWTERFRPVLAPLAVARGDGFTTSELAAVASRLAGRPVSRTEAADVARVAFQFLEGTRPNGPFRPYHRSFADFLTDEEENPEWTIDEQEAHAAVAGAFIAGVPVDDAGRRRWDVAPAYARTELGFHAAAAGVLDEILIDAGYLLEADPHTLLAVFDDAGSASAKAAAAAYRAVATRLADPAQPCRRGYLQLAAFQADAETLLASLRDRPEAEWLPIWAWWRRPTPGLVVADLPSRARALATSVIAGTPIAVAGGEFGLEAWDLDRHRCLATNSDPVAALACATVDGDAMAIAVRHDGMVAAHALPSLNLATVSRESPHERVLAVRAVETLQLIATGGSEGSIALWRLPDLELVATRPLAHTMVRALADGAIGVEPVLVSAGDTIDADGRRVESAPPVRVWSLPALDPVCELATESSIVQAIGAAAVSDGCLVLVPYLGRIEVELVRASGAVDSIGAFDGWMERCLVLNQGRPCELLVFQGGLATAVTIEPAAFRLAVGGGVETEAGEVDGPLATRAGRVVVTATRKLTAWNVNELTASSRTSVQLRDRQREHGVEALAVASDVLAALTSSGAVRRWRWPPGNELDALQLRDARLKGVASCELDGCACLVLAYTDGVIEAVEAHSGDRIAQPINASEELQAIAARTLNEHALVAAAVQVGVRSNWLTERSEPSYGVRIWDLESDTELPTRDEAVLAFNAMRGAAEDDALTWKLTAPGYADRPFDVVALLGDDEQAYVAAASDRAIAAWSLPECREAGRESRSYPVQALASEGALLAIAEFRGEVELWCLESQPGPKLIARHANVAAVAIASWHGTNAVLTGGGDGLLRIWGQDGNEIGSVELGEPITALAPLATGDIAIGTRRGIVVVRPPASE